MSKNTRYVCESCGARFGYAGVVKYCPSCGNTLIKTDRDRARDRAQKYIDECNELKEKAEAAFEAYAEIYGDYEFRMQTLRQYKKARNNHRGADAEAEQA